ncbi:hypothetical protein CRE_23611 [Caenorhabditis remanei]|uniref:Uncharacterized protein n=1 Tax=Caenorhabditis remanei TaxID=31234 RepID=E3MVU1_CAERE|nr:hypothetical protein CRE_23611 [Caenorhabditis remanei]
MHAKIVNGSFADRLNWSDIGRTYITHRRCGYGVIGVCGAPNIAPVCHVAGRHGMGKRMSKEVGDDAEKKAKERSRFVREKKDERKMTKMMELKSRRNYEDYIKENKLEEDEQEPEAVQHSIDLLCIQFSQIKIN